MSSSRSNSTSRPDVIGLIQWLPPRTEFTEDFLVRTDVPEGCFNHPVVILTTDVTGVKVVILKITSFNDLHFEKKLPCKSARRLHYLPVWPSPQHPDFGTSLQLEHSRPLRKNSYVNTGECYITPLSALRSYDKTGTEYRLDIKARVTLITHLQLHESSEPSIARFLQFVERKKNQLMRSRLLSQVSTNERPHHIPIRPSRGSHSHDTGYGTPPTAVIEHRRVTPVSKIVVVMWIAPMIILLGCLIWLSFSAQHRRTMDSNATT